MALVLGNPRRSAAAAAAGALITAALNPDNQRTITNYWKAGKQLVRAASRSNRKGNSMPPIKKRKASGKGKQASKKTRKGKTKPKFRKSEVQHGRGNGIPGTISKFVRFAKPSKAVSTKILKKITRTLTWQLDFGAQQTTAYNEQTFKTWCTLYDQGAFAHLFEQLGAGAATGSQTAGNVYNTVRVFAKSVGLKVLLTNMTSVPVKLILYLVKVRKHAKADENHIAPEHFFVRGVDDQHGDTDATAEKRVNVKPEQYDAFNHTFKIVKKTHLWLDAGAVHEHNIHLGTNRVFNSYNYLNKGSGDAISGWTYHLCGLLHGSVLHDKTTQTNVGTASALIDYACFIKYKIKRLPNDIRVNDIEDSGLGAISTGTTMTKDQDEEDLEIA